MTLQAGRYLVSCYREAKSGKHQPKGVDYLNNIDKLIVARCSAQSHADVASLDLISEAFSAVCAHVVSHAGREFEQCLERGLETDAAHEATCTFPAFNIFCNSAD